MTKTFTAALHRRMTWFGVLLLALFAVGFGSVAHAATELWAGFEAAELGEDGLPVGWTLKENGTEMELSHDPTMVSEGTNSLLVTLVSEPGSNRRVMVTWTPGEEGEDWSDVKGMYVDVFNRHTDRIRFGFAIQTGDGWVWQELAPNPIEPGWTKDIYLSFDQAVWKSAATGWTYILPPTGLENLRGINFLIVSYEDGTFQFTLDNVRIVR